MWLCAMSACAETSCRDVACAMCVAHLHFIQSLQLVLLITIFTITFSSFSETQRCRWSLVRCVERLFEVSSIGVLSREFSCLYKAKLGSNERIQDCLCYTAIQRSRARHTAFRRRARGAWAGDWREIEIGREIDGTTWHVLCYPGGQAAAPQLPGRGVGGCGRVVVVVGPVYLRSRRSRSRSRSRSDRRSRSR